MKCPSCGYENKDDARYCNLCQNSFVREPVAAYGLPSMAEPSKEAKKAVEQVLRSQPKGLNWFQRHLNWTWVFAAFGVVVLNITVVAFCLVYNLGSYSDLYSYLGGGQLLPSSSVLAFIASILVVEVIFLVLQGLATYGVGAWVLKRKARSLWWLLIFVAVLPIAWFNELLGAVAAIIAIIWFLSLKNYNLLDEVPASAGPSSSGPSRSSIPPGLAPQGLGKKSDKYWP